MTCLRHIPNAIDLVVITYNHEMFIDECLLSVQSQTVKPRSITIIDDCSVDGTMERIMAFAKRNQDISVVKHKNRMGITKTANHALSIGSSEYIKILCGDDYLSEHALELHLDALHRSPDASFSYSNMLWFYCLPFGIKISFKHYSCFTRPTASIQSLINDNTLPAPTMVMRRSKLKDIKFSEKFASMADLVFILMCLEAGPAVFVDKLTTFYRRHGHNSSSILSYKNDRTLLCSLLQEGKLLKGRYNVDELENLLIYSCLLEEVKAERIWKSLSLLLDLKSMSVRSPKWFLRIALILFRIAKIVLYRIILPNSRRKSSSTIS